VKLVAAMDDFESAARSAVKEAGNHLRAAWRSSKTVHYKGPIDLVTETDREVEVLVADRLRRAFPDHLIIGEEASAGVMTHAPDAQQYVWYLDPLDGTTNFAHSYPHFAVSLALARGDELLLGIVHDPIRGETFAARRGGGATLNDEKIQVSSLDRLNHALLGTGFAYDRRERADFYLGFFKDFMTRVQGVRRNGSAALDLCYVACGRFDGFWEWKLQPWDIAAGVLIVREAGGRVTDFSGGPFDLHGQQTLASNGRIHGEMIYVLQDRLGQPDSTA
jgi:myo-inositol-1(or 4)-monophosphatase